MPQNLRLSNRMLGRQIKVSQSRPSSSKIHHYLPLLVLDCRLRSQPSDLFSSQLISPVEKLSITFEQIPVFCDLRSRHLAVDTNDISRLLYKVDPIGRKPL